MRSAHCFFVLFFVLSVSFPLFSRNKAGNPPSIPVTAMTEEGPGQTLANAGNVSYWLSYDGSSAIDPDGNSGVIYPRGTAGVVYQDGLVWGARVAGDNGLSEIRVGGSTYRTGTQALSSHVYRIRRDWRKLTPVGVLRETAEFFQIKPTEVTEAQTLEIIAQYKKDWKEWPVEQGAPWVDRDGDGVYNPVTDENGLPDARKGDYPGIIGADQVIWYKVDDQDSTRTKWLYGSLPMGVELQVTVWSYARSWDETGQAVFKKYTLRNISDKTFEEMYLSQWSDPDIGNYSDDLVGCDSSLQSIFAYNSNLDAEFSPYNIDAPAVAYVLLQGPVIPSPGDSAYFNGDIRQDYKNLPMTSFGYFSAGNTEWTDPVLGDYDGTLQWYNLLRGYISNNNIDNPTPFTHRSTGEATKFPLDGDPLAGTGDIDGQDSNFAPGDRRMLLASGPFSLNPGEEQEMVVALVGGVDMSPLRSISNLKANIKEIRAQYGKVVPYPGVSYTHTYPDNRQTTLHISVDLMDFPIVDSCSVTVIDTNGSSPPQTIALFDDGTHDDGEAGDGVWGNGHTFENRKGAQSIDVHVFSPEGAAFFPAVKNLVRLRPLPELKNFHVSWEDGPQDRQLNVNENIHLGYDIQNVDEVNRIDILEVKKEPTAKTYKNLWQGRIISGDSVFLAIQGPSITDTISYFVNLSFENFSEYVNYKLPMAAVETGEYYRDTIRVISVKGTTNKVLLLVADQSQMTTHHYSIAFKEDTLLNKRYWQLWDETLHVLKLERGEISNDPFYPFPVIDGIVFKIGDPEPGIDPADPWSVEGDRWISGTDWGGRYFFGGLDIGKEFFGSTISDPADYKDIAIYWAADTINDPYTTDPADLVAASREQFPDRWSKGQTYRRDLGYPMGGPGWIPFSVYNLDEDPPQRLNIVFIEDANNGTANLLWDMGWSNGAFSDLGGREYTYFMASEYNEGNDYDNVNWGPIMDVMYALWPQARGSRPYLSAPFTMYINGADVHLAGDSLVFESPTTLGDDLANVPQRYYLKQNYPNPFNPVTRINFGLAQNSTVKLRIFNILGQEVRMLINGYLGAGRHDVQWDGRNDQGRLLSSGVYIYKLTAGEFSRSRKMILLK